MAMCDSWWRVGCPVGVKRELEVPLVTPTRVHPSAEILDDLVRRCDGGVLLGRSTRTVETVAQTLDLGLELDHLGSECRLGDDVRGRSWLLGLLLGEFRLRVLQVGLGGLQLLTELTDLLRRAVHSDLDVVGVGGVDGALQERLQPLGQRSGIEQEAERLLLAAGCAAGAESLGGLAAVALGERALCELQCDLSAGGQRCELLEEGFLGVTIDGSVVQQVVEVGSDLVAELLDLADGRSASLG